MRVVNDSVTQVDFVIWLEKLLSRETRPES